MLKFLTDALSALVIAFLFFLTMYGIVWCMGGIAGILL